MVGLRILVALLIALILISGYIYAVVKAQPSESEARQAFEQSGCTSCHTWDDLTSEITSMAQSYNSLDEAAQDIGYSSFNDLMTTMKSYANQSGGITDQQYQIIYEYFTYLFNSSKQVQTTTTTTTTTTSQTTTATTTQTTTTGVKTTTQTETKYTAHNESTIYERTVTKTVPIAKPPATFNYAALVAAILVLAGLAYLVYQVSR